ncbi:MAG: hypothetical protein BWY52_03300 [Chloroflexi bacterium ADurb.Bin325]|nr:MAG: hypothetical protein BWY52_03300 [Chloroflexi bacterium ADurb.Bin325]
MMSETNWLSVREEMNRPMAAYAAAMSSAAR